MKYLIGLAVAVGFALSAGGAVAQSWNAVALDFAGAEGIIYGAESEDAAKQQALDTCGNENCQSIVSTDQPCMGVAYTPEQGGYYGYAHGVTKEGSATIALGYCIEGGYGSCEIMISQCVPPAAPPPGPGPKTKTKG